MSDPGVDRWNDPCFAAQRLTRAAYRALASSALLAGGRRIGPDHLFAALARLEVSIAARCLRVLGVTWDALEVPPAAGRPAAEDVVPLEPSPSVAELLRRASDEAAALGHHPATTGHLVLAILAEPAGPLPSGAALTHGAFVAALRDVVGRPWVHGHALDGELALYVTRDEALVLFGLVARRATPRLHPAEGVVLRDLERLLRPVCQELLRHGPARLDEARRAVARLGRVVAGPEPGASSGGS